MFNFVTCEQCASTGRLINHWPTVALLDDGQPDLSNLARFGTLAENLDHFEVEVCHKCKGLAVDGVSYARYRDKYDTYGDAYKSVSTIKAAITRGTAVPCKTCNGRGTAATLYIIGECSHCTGRGSVASHFEPGDVVPEGVKLDSYMTGHQHWAQTVPLILVRSKPNEVLSWGVSHLGLGTVYAVTDYGTAYGQNDIQVAESVRKHLGDSGQWSKIVDSGSRIVAPEIVVTITTNGYAVTSTASMDQATRAMLPPTYTADLLNGPS